MEDFKAKFNYPKVVDDSSCTVTCPVTQVGHSVVYIMLQRKVASYRDDNLCKCVCVSGVNFFFFSLQVKNKPHDGIQTLRLFFRMVQSRTITLIGVALCSL
jgi:hypothetical protein